MQQRDPLALVAQETDLHAHEHADRDRGDGQPRHQPEQPAAPARARLGRQHLHELDVGQQCADALPVRLERQSPRVGIEQPQIAGQQVVADQGVDVQEQEHHRGECVGDHHRHRDTELGERPRRLAQQVFVRGRDHRRREVQADEQQQERTRLRRLGAVVDAGDQALQILGRLESAVRHPRLSPHSLRAADWAEAAGALVDRPI